MNISYNTTLITLSAIIAVTAGYFTIEMASEITLNKGLERWIWLGIGSLTMGMGIWGMHFIAMTSLSMKVEITYNFVLVLVSLIAAIAGCAQGLYIITRPLVNNMTLVAASISMGSAIAGMHYIGMAAMRVAANITYNLSLLILSVVIAIVVSLVAMKITIALRVRKNNQKYLLTKVIASLVMGAAVLSMHYTGMAAANFKFDPTKLIEQANILDNEAIGFCVGLAVIGVFGMVYVFLMNSGLSRSTSR